ncbi:MAG: hypothetical protein ACI96W_003821, partial [Paraglaciecola sp.]
GQFKRSTSRTLLAPNPYTLYCKRKGSFQNTLTLLQMRYKSNHEI